MSWHLDQRPETEEERRAVAEHVEKVTTALACSCLTPQTIYAIYCAAERLFCKRRLYERCWDIPTGKFKELDT
jgi:hypothetical protein